LGAADDVSAHRRCRALRAGLEGGPARQCLLLAGAVRRRCRRRAGTPRAEPGSWTVTGPPEGSGANANNFEVTDAAGFPVGASITTPDSILMGYGVEGISTAAARNAVMNRVLAHLLD
jgi:hypothetical protein